ncbi:hypothetical protein [Aporhodopirellula aestuarii]|uniref:Protein PsbN n=1 Tax=Aporhodopirellula aestuarii TaxID=2950107 RepID=A0ABT0U8W5_9BACT|nr:hypothetical protein [Aporhodopirellula aestuarii]MCM2373321.1 hypothetical protein [Aporhodopirellula aestuarii]
MTAGGLSVMVLSIGAVISMLSFCLYKVLTLPPVEEEFGDEDTEKSKEL